MLYCSPQMMDSTMLYIAQPHVRASIGTPGEDQASKVKKKKKILYGQTTFCRGGTNRVGCWGQGVNLGIFRGDLGWKCYGMGVEKGTFLVLISQQSMATVTHWVAHMAGIHCLTI